AISAFNAADRWGQISFSNASPSTLAYTLLNHAGHSPGVGHTGRGPMLRLAGSDVSLLDSVLADGPAKAMYSSGSCDIVIQGSLIERMITGPEFEDGISLVLEDSNLQFILPHYRESNSATPDDEDCLYIHNGAGRPIEVRRTVLARCGDDVFDCLGGPILIEDSILREAWDKGMSLLDNDLIIRRTQIIDCDKGIVPKSRTAVTRTINVDHVTIVAEDHDQSQSPWGYTVPVANPDPDTPSTGLYTQDKAGQSDPGATIAITATNSIIIAKEPIKVDPIYAPANTVVTFSDLLLDTGSAFAWPGVGNFSNDPMFVNGAGNDFHLSANSPAIDAGTPAGTDVGALPFDPASTTGGALTWTPAGSPYHVTGDLTIPSGTTLVINPGTSIFVDQNRTITVNGTIKVNGTENAHVIFSNVPGVTATDPITGVGGQPAKWGGIIVVGPTTGPAITGSEFRYCTFLNAQPPVAAGNTGSLGIIRAFALIDHCTFLGTHLRQVYGENCALQIQYCTFVDPFDPLNNADNPVAYSLDNIAEPLKVANANITNPNYVFGLPVGGYFRVWYNEFRGNKGHNDVFDADSGGFNNATDLTSATPNPILDCRYNNFLGLTGDEHIDLGGDAYIAGNIFQRGHKDMWTNDHGYSNCISSGDKSGATTIWVARNIAFNVDHMINCKAATATIFESNTIANFYADFSYTSTPPVAPFTQNVKSSAVNQYVPDDIGPTRGDGAYIANNIFHNIPRVVSWADLPDPPATATKLEATNNYINGLTDNSVGPAPGGTQHPGGFTALGSYVQPGDPQFMNEAEGDYTLKPTSPARGTAPGGMDYGATVAEWIHITGGPFGTTNQTTATFTISGPAMVAYKYRLDGGAWSAVQTIGNGLIFPRGATPTVRQATLTLPGLTAGTHTLEVVGRDPAGNWQDTDIARTVAGLAPLAPSTRTWTVDLAATLVRLNEVLAISATEPDAVELYNAGTSPVNIAGWILSDSSPASTDYTFPANTVIPANGYLVVPATVSGVLLDKDGDAVFLRNGAVLVDSVAFGPQVRDLTIGRTGTSAEWNLCQPTLGSANVKQRLGTTDQLEISEWFANGNVLYDDDWLELHNLAPLPVSLTGAILTDNAPGNPVAHVLAPLSFIGADGYVQLWADGKPELGPAHLSFQLEAQQEEIVLKDAAGRDLDFILFFPQVTDYSQGRDGAGKYGFYELPTGGFANGTSDPAYANALALLHGLRITAIMFNPLGGSDYEYIELRNVGSTPLDVTGAEFVEGISYVFPSRILNPGETILLVHNEQLFRARYGAGPVIDGVFTGSLDNAGEKLALQLPPPFDANIMNFTYNDGWYPPTDGGGFSLVVVDPLASAGLWGDHNTWMASTELGGSPGGAALRTDTFSGWSGLMGVNDPLDDGDKDGVFGIIEFGLDMDPNDPNGLDGAAGVPAYSVNASGHGQLQFGVPANPAAAQGHGRLQVNYAVQARDLEGDWETIAAKTFTTAWAGTGAITVGAPVGGRVPITVGDPGPSDAPRLMRLQITFVP
ncbi:MAG: lamin tail domain-containing protein, partial [Chthoniobacteraceae bacterium]